jgi:hypothetical protein
LIPTVYGDVIKNTGSAVHASGMLAELVNSALHCIHENFNPGADYIVLTVRTGLETLDVWIQQSEGRDLFGQIISSGESQRVWEIRYRPRQSTPYTILINANHSYELDEYTTGQFFQINRAFEIQRAEPVLIQPTQAIPQRQRRDPNREYTAEWRGIEISGSGHFVDRTFLALEFLENGPGWGYDYVVTYLDYIVQDRTIDNTAMASYPSRPNGTGNRSDDASVPLPPRCRCISVAYKYGAEFNRHSMVGLVFNRQENTLSRIINMQGYP